MTALLRLLSGFLLLVFGKSLFWLLMAALGFLIGASLATQFVPRESEWVVLVVALAVGLAGALLALVLPNVIGAVAGFASGGYLAVTLVRVVDVNLGDLSWLLFLIGGIVGAIIVLTVFDWALIGLSSLAGAVTIASVLAPRGPIAVVVIAILFVIGVMVQAGLVPWTQRRQV